MLMKSGHIFRWHDCEWLHYLSALKHNKKNPVVIISVFSPYVIGDNTLQPGEPRVYPNFQMLGRPS